MAKIRLAGVIRESIVDGPGIRFTVFTQGCPHKCKGCHNPQTHDFNGGYFTDTDVIFEELKKDPLLQGVTFSGGEPFMQPRPLLELAKKAHSIGLNVMAYTGFLYETLKKQAESDPYIDLLLKEVDILVDGPFIQEQKTLMIPFRGSKNQRMLYLTDGEIDEQKKAESDYAQY